MERSSHTQACHQSTEDICMGSQRHPRHTQERSLQFPEVWKQVGLRWQTLRGVKVLRKYPVWFLHLLLLLRQPTVPNWSCYTCILDGHHLWSNYRQLTKHHLIHCIDTPIHSHHLVPFINKSLQCSAESGGGRGWDFGWVCLGFLWLSFLKNSNYNKVF